MVLLYWHFRARSFMGYNPPSASTVALESIHVPSFHRTYVLTDASFSEPGIQNNLAMQIDFDFAKFCYESLNIIIRKKKILHTQLRMYLKVEFIIIGWKFKEMHSTHMFKQLLGRTIGTYTNIP